MNLKIKKMVLCGVLGCMVLSITPMIGVSANTITKKGIAKTPNSITGLTYTYAFTGTSGGYAAAQVYGYGISGVSSGALTNTAEGYNSWAQTQQSSYRASYYNDVVGRHWSDAEYSTTR